MGAGLELVFVIFGDGAQSEHGLEDFVDLGGADDAAFEFGEGFELAEETRQVL